MQTTSVVLDVIILRHHSYNSKSSEMAFIPILAAGAGIGLFSGLFKGGSSNGDNIRNNMQSEINSMNISHFNDIVQ